MSDVKIEQRELSDGQRAYYAWLNTHFLSDNQIERIKAEFEYLQAENVRLREELAKARDPQRIGGQADPSSFVYAIEQLREFRWQHATNDEDAIPYINNVAAAHERENAKFRKLVETMHSDMREMLDTIDKGSDTWGFCRYYGECLECAETRMRELGIEVE